MVMKKIQLLCILAVLSLFLIIPGTAIAEKIPIPARSSDQYKEGYRFNVQGWIYVHVQGEPLERGYQHGYLLAAEIIDMLQRWSTIIHNYPIIKTISKRLSDSKFDKMSEIWWNFCTTQCYRMYWDKFPEEYQQEIKGIADGVVARGGKLFGRNVNYQDILTMNEMYEFLSKLTTIPKGIHPLRTLFQQLQQVVPGISHVNISSLIETFLQQSPAHHCNGFIATGNATSHDQLVFSQSTICGGGTWWWTYYISLRWNVILDIQPSKGHRIIMPTSPGLIWSDEDYYQNDNGLVLLETTVPQGLFDNKGLPLCIRVRTAIQYGNDIDDMLFSLRYRNDGSMNAVWLLGDTKTGEISRLDLGYRHSAVWRTFNGFFWSANNPRDFRVRLERVNYKKFLLNFVYCNILGFPGWGYFSFRYIPVERDIKFEELGNKYYGTIDVETVKQIMCTPPISDWITDVKVTDSDLMRQNGLWAFFGNPHHSLFISNYGSQIITTEEVPPTGWVLLYGTPVKENFKLITQDGKITPAETTVTWEFDTKQNMNNFTSAAYAENNRLYITIPSGVLFSINPQTGSLQWQTTIGKNPTAPIAQNGFVFVGDEEGIAKFSERGTQQWKIPTDGMIVSQPIIIEDNVLFADSYGNVYSLAMSTGQEQWRLKFSNESFLSSFYDENIYLTSGDNCYAVKRNNHSIVWTFASKGKITSAPVFSNNTVYVSSWDNYIYALDAETGEVKWKYQTGWGFDCSPAVSNGFIFVGAMDNNLYAFDEDGILKWIFTGQASIQSTPVTYGDFVIFGCDDGNIYAVNQSDGAAVWSFAPRFTIDGVMNYATTSILSNPIVVNGTVIIGANGTIYGLNSQTIEVPRSLQQKLNQDIFSMIPLSWYLWIFLIFIVIIIILYAVFRKKN
jgi:outer membrane protein assembly factor BamB